MHPSSLLSYYPTYEILDEVLSYGDITHLNLYFDLKNNLQTLYLDHAIKNIVETSLMAKRMDTSIFSSIISFISYHKLYSLKRNIKINFYTFFESGVSYYHTNLNKKYKISRRVDDLYGLDKEKRELFFKIYHKNLMLIERALNRMPNNKVIRLANLEADFVPYYLIKNKLVRTESDTAHIVYSNDHDLLQTVEAGDNVFIFQKAGKIKRIVKSNEIMKIYFKEKMPDSYFPLGCSIIGDTGDDIDGVKDIGIKRAVNILDDIVTMSNGIESLYENVFRDRDIFTHSSRNKNKYINKVVESEKNKKLISRNLKLISFELLSRYLDAPMTIEMYKKKQNLINILKASQIAPMDSMQSALDKLQVYLIEEDLYNIYYGYKF